MGRYALLIGTDTYENADLPPLSAPISDIERLARVLRDPAIGAFDEVPVMINRPSHEQLIAIGDLVADRNPEDLVLLYLSCHGVKDLRGRLHFAAVNTRVDRLAGSSVPANFVNDQLGDAMSAGSRVLILDCCFSGSFTDGFAPKSGNESVLDDVGGTGYVVMTASDGFSPAFEDTTAEAYSVFTDVIVSGLMSGAADKDLDGVVSTNDLFDYASPLVRARSPQRPHYLAANMEGKVVLAHAAQRVMPTRDATPVGSSAVTSTQPFRVEGAAVLTWDHYADRIGIVVERYSLNPSTMPSVAGYSQDKSSDKRIPLIFGGPLGLAARLIAVDSSALPAVVRLIASSRSQHAASTKGTIEHESVARGWRAASHGWWEEAQTQFGSAVRNEPLSFTAWWGMGCCYGVANAWSRAADAFTKAARYASVNSTEIAAGAMLLRAASMDLGGLPGVERVLQSALSTAPDCPELMAAVAIRMGDMSLLARVAKVDPALAIVLSVIELSMGGDGQSAFAEVAESLEHDAAEVLRAWAAAREMASDFMVPLLPGARRRSDGDLLGRMLASLGEMLEVRARAATIENSLLDSSARVLADMQLAHAAALREANPGEPPLEPQGSWLSILKATEWDSYREAMKKYDAGVVAHERMKAAFQRREIDARNVTPIRDVLLALATPPAPSTGHAIIAPEGC